ncbi:probable disease resistance protein RPP1 isoform X2 [Capsella rubella]|uniref:probable disease resistance protein RPP1 isoform X2 n=1 Tax=Capsella rubella TaxID=81985 RepID=UPI000CD4EBA0|nr:probable disease resistance protein RPP1 isoform X2 [Capsella rubella]
MGSVMSSSCNKRKATSQEDVESESVKRQKVCSSSTNDDENCKLILQDEFSWKRPLSFCVNRVVNASAVGFFTQFTKVRFQLDDKDTISSLSLPSPSTSVSQIWKFDVFPSFHGPDVRRAFLSHIFVVFKGMGINTFIDNDIQRSKSIGPELMKAIRGSKIAIVLLSKNYASSSWCLDELAEIMKCREVPGQIVMTIFYEVEPTDIKKQTGDFGKAFRKTCKGKTKERIERWRKALEDVATIAGYHTRNWVNEAGMIEQIAIDVSSMLICSTPSKDFDNLVGMGAHMKRMKRLLRLDMDDVRMIGIWGPPGIGKTTIARVLFNQVQVSNKFQHSAFMVNIKRCYPRPCFDEYDAQLQLQEQMLSKMINQKDIKISHLGVAQERLKEKKVFLVLDEVDHLGQLDALAKETRWFGPGSRIIITTENMGVLKAHGINHIYKVNTPSSGELPLGLKVLGSALRRKSKQEWKSILPRLRTSLDGEIESIIKFSYDALCDEDKYLFLYLACFFLSESTYKVGKVLANKFSDVRQGLYVLAERSLISIEYGMIGMHTLIHQFGRETSRKQFIQHGLRKHYLLAGARDICEELSDDTTDNRRFIGINLDLSNTEEELNIREKAVERMFDLQFVRINGLDLDQPERLHSLLHYSQMIRLLDWSYFQNICLPSSFNPEFLVELALHHNKLQKLWEGTRPLRNLRWMYLSYSTDLKELPDISTATNLEILYLGKCSSLVELPSCIGELTSLRILDLNGCSSLVKIPASIENTTNLRRLVLSGCDNVVELPSIGNETKLEQLILNNCSRLVKLPSSINATNLQEMSLSNCSLVVELPTIENANNLNILDLSNCSSLLELPPSIGTAKNLEKLDISGCLSILELPSSIGNLQRLSTLTMCGCSKLEALPTNINLKSLDRLDLSDCSELKSFPEISRNIEYLNIIGTAVKEVPMSIMSLSRLSDFRMSYFESLKDFPRALDIITELQLNKDIQEVAPWVKEMSRLRVLKLHNCNHLVSLPQFSDSLSCIDADNCKSLERLDCSFNNPKIRLKFTNCFKLKQEAKDLIMHTSTRGYAILPGAQVPACFNHRATAGRSLKFKLNESTLPTFLRFKACIMLDMHKDEADDDDDNDDASDDDEDDSSMGVTMDNTDEQKDHKVWCIPCSRNMKRFLTEHIYTFIVEAEDVTSTELIFEFKLDSGKWKIGEWGLLQILDLVEETSCS